MFTSVSVKSLLFYRVKHNKILLLLIIIRGWTSFLCAVFNEEFTIHRGECKMRIDDCGLVTIQGWLLQRVKNCSQLLILSSQKPTMTELGAFV